MKKMKRPPIDPDLLSQAKEALGFTQDSKLDRQIVEIALKKLINNPTIG